ncbi:MAG: primosomal protein N' [Acidobacteria bacterium]|nr:primosomal protein N' [Acidobacteriota bacterium]
MGRKKVAEPQKPLVNVAVLAAIREPLTYCVPDSLDVRVGQRVLVPLGTRKATGIVLEPVASLPPGVRAREILRVLDPEPVLSPELLTLGLWIADYYLAPVGEVFRGMLPLRPESRHARLLEITDAGRRKLAEFDSSLLDEARIGKEAEVLRYVSEHAGAPLEGVRRRFAPVSAEMVSAALAEGWLSVAEVERERGRRKIMAVRLAARPADDGVHGPVPERSRRLSPVAQRIVEALERNGPVGDHRELLKNTRATLGHLKKLDQEGWLQLTDSKGDDEEFSQSAKTVYELTPEQGRVLDELTGFFEKGRFEKVLLHGITGSGKTEIYLRLVARCLERGRDALLLVPEIALTPAVQSQFLTRFGNTVAVLHSGLSENERHDAWWRGRRGEAKAVLGTRSAVFAPLANLGVIIVDEEHDSSYKQEETPRYHGRDVAVVRAKLANAVVVLGSATPSLESYWNAREGKYRLATLSERVGSRLLASVEIVDMRQEFRETHTQVPISRRLKEEIEAQLRTGAQTMILLNRRGYSWFLLCRSCGETQRCVNCSISLTYHRREHRLICHYCGYSASIPAACPSCGSEYLHYVGEGTEKLEAKFAEVFPGARVARLDRDVAQRAGYFRRVLTDFRQGKIDILVGTQLISKGHDFPGVTLVGVVSADLGLGLPDFRAAERTFQLLTQAAGRAGRGDSPGRVLVQTFFPEHYAIRLAADQNYEGFYSKEMRFRRMMRYPPCWALANVIAQDVKLEQAARVAGQIGKFLEGVDGARGELKILGPSPAPLARIEGRYRIQFLLKAGSRARLNEILRRLVDDCDRRGISPRSVMIDMDPVSVM